MLERIVHLHLKNGEKIVFYTSEDKDHILNQLKPTSQNDTYSLTTDNDFAYTVTKSEIAAVGISLFKS
ncbi:hypothetical protein [Priestia koreensis]|uniref:hypothetical protein n=1 Tax=Priestia koreensis TaxID=284581 RepID=UPI0030185D2E